MQAKKDPATFGYGDCITWPIGTTDWFPRSVLMSLIALIPFVGPMALAGWVLTAADNLHRRDLTVPPAGFHLRRGARLYLVAFVWGLLAAVLVYGFMFGVFGLFFQPQILGARLAPLLLFAWFGLVIGLGVASHLAFLFIVPGAAEADARRAWRGINPAPAIADVIHHPKDSILAALITYLAWIVASLGAFLCYVGAILTIGYGALIFAGAIYVYERNTKGITA